MINIFYFFGQQMLLCFVPLMIVALAGMYSERSGIINFSLEGLMLAGAFAGAMFLRSMQTVLPGNVAYSLALVVAGLAGIAVMMLHSYSSVSLGGSQIVSGMAVNLLIPALTIVLARAILGVLQVDYANRFLIAEIPVLSAVPIIGPIFFRQTYISTFIGFIVFIITVVVFKKTRFGMRLHAVGEHPQAAESLGIKVAATRYRATAISGFFAGLGGLAFIVPNASEYAASVAGYGYLACAVVIFGQWQPIRILWASVLFAFMKTIANVYTVIPFFIALGWSTYVYKMIPYIATVIILIFTSKKSSQPKALGEPYDRSVK
ncbi:MAG: ABC transporter permease [Clostridiales Family XIII bacterium]|nr:ABC transporter permease [Clostridiales Family XIII bacterium]